jgi:carboxyl-terminal processing protease
MRGNPGGLLDAAVGVSSVWLNKGSTVLEEKQNGVVVQTFKTSGQPVLAGVPTVVLINGGSASASEIVAGALKDNQAATLIGEQTFGKGSVQRVIPLSGGGSLKVTIARWFTPSGQNIDKEGIAPDQVIELTSEDREAGRDPQLDAAIETLNQ